MATEVVYAPSTRARIILAIAIGALVLLLGVLVFLFYGLVQPGGIPKGDGATNELEWVRSIYGYGPTPIEQLLAPSSVAIGPDGDIFATDPQRGRVMVFRSDGTFRRVIQTGAGGTAEGMFMRPESIDVDGDGNLYIADVWAGKIVVFDSDGNFAREWNVENQASGVSVVEDKVSVIGAGKVLVFDMQGKRLASFGSRGPRPGQIDAYQGVTSDGDSIFVAEPFNKRLQAFDAKGTLQWTFPRGTAPRTGPTRGGSAATSATAKSGIVWDLPQDLVFDGRGRLVVIDAFRFELVVVDPKSGEPIAKYGEFGTDDGQMYYPSSVDYDARRDWFAVADTRNNRIQVFRIPDSGNAASAAAWRALASPYRYLILPGVLLLAGLAFGVWMVKRSAQVLSLASPPIKESGDS